MKFKNKKIFIIASALFLFNDLCFADGGGAFAGGLAGSMIGGIAISAAANSGNRRSDDPGYWEYKRNREEDAARARTLRNYQRELDKLERQARNLRRKIDNTKNETERTRLSKDLERTEKRTQELNDKIADLE